MKTKVGVDISEAASLLKAGQLVAIPTETVYGLAGNGLDTRALASIFAVKERPAFDPLIVHTDTLEKVSGLVTTIPLTIQRLAKQFSPGPLTFVLPRKPAVPDLATAGKPTVAIRIPDHPATLQLLRELPFPLAAPSANPFGYVSPTSPAHVLAQLDGAIPFILDGGSSVIGVESTIVQPGEKGIEVLRLGGTPVEKLEAVIKPVTVKRSSASAPTAPGQLASHYAPGTKVRVGDPQRYLRKIAAHKLGVISFRHWHQGIPAANQYVLSPKGDLTEAAGYLFDALRKLDREDLKVVVAEEFPEEGLGRAINDRLARAAARVR